MSKLSWAIRQKMNWQKKIQSEDIVAKWRDEAASSQEGLTEDVKLTPNMVSICGFAENARLLDASRCACLRLQQT